MADSQPLKSTTSIAFGAAFLMATSAVGPGFLTQTTVFTKQLLASFGFVILLSVVLDIFAQLNIWRVLSVTGKRGQDIANETIPGSGYLLAGLVAFGGSSLTSEISPAVASASIPFLTFPCNMEPHSVHWRQSHFFYLRKSGGRWTFS